MRPNKTCLVAGLSLLMTAVGANGAWAADDDDGDWDVDFGNSGFEIASPDGDFRLQFGGRLHLDAMKVYEGVTPFQDEADIRRLRVDVSGRIFKDWRFKVDGDVGGTSPGFKNVWLAYRGFDNMEFKGGNFIAPFSMEDMMSSNAIPMMERSLAQALAPGFLVGGGAKYWGDHWTVTAGYFLNPIDFDPQFNTESGQSFAGRVTYAPIRRRHHLIHFGVGVERRDLDNGVVSKVRALPELGLAENSLINTGSLVGINSFTNVNGEAVFMEGPFMVAGQYIKRFNNAAALGDPNFDGGYVLASWVLTGESRRYSRRSGMLGGIRPKSEFGAIELVGRYSMLDLNDGLVTGGEEQNLSVGVNWYLGRNLRLMGNYVHGKASPNKNGVNESLDALQGRIQIYF